MPTNTSHNAPPPRHDPASLAHAWAVMSLAATVVTGGWMRAALAWPSLGLGIDLSHAVHAHSHAAFFGWLVLGFAAVSVDETPAWSARRQLAWELTVHAIGVLSLVALVAFARWGYAVPTIVLSALHVALWFVLVAVLDVRHRHATERDRWWRTTWTLLLLAGALTTLPAVLAVRGVHGGWWREFSIKLFLALFVNGFALLATVATLLPTTDAAPATRPTRALDTIRRVYVIALLPLAVLYVDTAPSFAWLAVAAHIGIGVMGLCTVVIAWYLRRTVRTPALRAALAGYLLIGVLQLIAATGVADALMRARPITIAFTHLELLLVVTPLLAIARAPTLARSWHTVTCLALGGAMCAALVCIGWPWLAGVGAAAGVPYLTWFPIVGATGVLAALAYLTLTARLMRATAHTRDTTRPFFTWRLGARGMP